MGIVRVFSPLIASSSSSRLPVSFHQAVKADISSGKEVEYQDMAYASRSDWLEWNQAVADTQEHELPVGFDRDTTLFVPCGFMRVSSGTVLSAYDVDCLYELEKAGLREHQNHIVSGLT